MFLAFAREQEATCTLPHPWTLLSSLLSRHQRCAANFVDINLPFFEALQNTVIKLIIHTIFPMFSQVPRIITWEAHPTVEMIPIHVVAYFIDRLGAGKAMAWLFVLSDSAKLLSMALLQPDS